MTAFAPTLAGRRQAGSAGALRSFAGESRRQDFSAPQMRAQRSTEDGKEFVTFDGYASVVDVTYTMWDWYGEYDELIAPEAFDKTLAADPDVAFLLNHTGMTMARTASGTLELSVDSTGLRSIAKCNPQRNDVADLAHAIEDGDIDQMSFAFRIVDGKWSPDYTQYSILEVDLHRGDVSAVNYGASPHTSISARAQQAFDSIEHLEGAPLAAAAARANARLAELTPSSTEERAAAQTSGPNAATLRARMELERA